MTCNEVRQNCQPFLDGELDCAQRCALEHHVVSCGECQSLLDSERASHAALRKMTWDCVRPPSDLAKRAFSRLDAPPKPAESKTLPLPHETPAKPAFARRVRSFAAAAAVVLCMLGGYAVYCSRVECRFVVAAVDTFDRIQEGRAPVLQTSSDVALLRQAVAKDFPDAVIPDLNAGKFTPQSCGEMQIAGCSGHYVWYGNGGSRTALLILKTSETPRGTKLQEDLVASNYSNHSLYSWHTQDKRFLCILVSLQPPEQTLPLAEMARAEFAAAPAH